MSTNVDKDGIWKDAIEQYLPLLLRSMMPELHNDVDFSQEFTFLDKELRDTIQVSMNEEHNAAKFVDTLVQVPLKSGRNQWVLLHIEVQGKGGEDISFRMMLYCCLIFAHYQRMPVALAILTDKRPSNETPGKFKFSEYGTELIYKYNLFEVYNQSDEKLLNSDNPFDSFIYAAKKYSDYMSSDAQKVKLEYLLKITRSLYARGLNEQDRARMIIFISRLINLEDAELRHQFFEELDNLKGENNMAELTWIEEHFRDEAIAKGIAIGEARGEARGEKRGEARGEKRGEKRGRSQALKAAIEFMRSNGMSNEQINMFRNSMKS
ncbi:MAG: hypothetical protein IJQ56_04865 [Synergistaceae bacterium]|nr:hypothetical protein [Synergistaceae bacterium]